MTNAPFPYRLAGTDLDGTLLGPDKQISPVNREAVRRLQERGVKFVLASGRRHQNSIRFYRDLALDTLLISCAGALVREPLSGDTVYEVLIPPALAEALVQEGLESGYTVIYYHRDHLYIGGSNRWVQLYESRVGEAAKFHQDLRKLRGDAALKIVWYGEPPALDKARRELGDTYAERLTILSTDAENIEFSHPRANKAAALSVVAGVYQIESAAAITFGDGENDAPMLRWAGLGVAMDHGNSSAKEAARVISPPGSPEESFARAVAQIIGGEWDHCVRAAHS